MKHFLMFCLCLATAPLAADEAEVRWQKKTAAEWAEDLADEDVRLRWYATYALGQIGPDAVAALDPLIELLKGRTQYEYVRGTAAWTIGRIGPAAEPALEVLVETLESNHISVRRNSPKALGALGPAARSAVPALLKLLEDGDATVVVNAAEALWRIERHPTSIRTLVETLQGKKPPGPALAAGALGRIGSEADGTAPALAAALSHDDQDVRRAAARALGLIGPTAIRSLKAPAGDSDSQVRRSAVEALGWIGPAAVPALVAMLTGDSPVARRAAARALGRLGTKAKTAEAALVKAINDRDPQVREAAARALGAVRRP